MKIGELDVSRETIERLGHFSALLEKWNPKINLVSKSTLQDGWQRHFVDSAQLFALCDVEAGTWLDIGSGGGFPGLVISAISKELKPDLNIVLVESDQRKCAFLRTVVRELDLTCQVRSERIELLAPAEAAVISARALADLTTLLSYASRHAVQDSICLFPKGRTWEKEVNEARDSWSFSMEKFKSETDNDAVVLKIKEISHV